MKRVRCNPRLTLFATTGLFLVVLAAALFEVWPALDCKELWQTVTSAERLQVFFGSFGLWAPIVFALIQAAQVVVSAVPAVPIRLAGVAAFGPWIGFGLSLSGAVAGSVAAFLLGCRLGRPVVERIVGEKVLERYADEMSPDGLWVLVALMVPLPAGGDVVCSVAGLSKMSLRRFTVIVFLGRIPYTALAVLTALGLTTGSPWLLAWASVVLSLLALAGLIYARHAKNDALREHKKVGTNIRAKSGECRREAMGQKSLEIIANHNFQESLHSHENLHELVCVASQQPEIEALRSESIPL